MKLHKLLYLVQAAHLVWFGAPAFSERIEAWIYGPVTRTVAGRYSQFGSSPITRVLGGRGDRLSTRQRWTIQQISGTYGRVDGFQLAEMLKADGSPWRQVREGLPDDVPSNEPISLALIASYHADHGLPIESRPSKQENELAQRVLDGDADALDDLFELVTGIRPDA